MLTERSTTTWKELAACQQNVDRGDAPLHFHCCSLDARVSVSHPPTTFDTVVLTAVVTISATLPEQWTCGGYESAIESRSQVHPDRTSVRRREKGGT